jgi:hypothetical protein
MIPPCGHGGATLGSLRPLIGRLMLTSPDHRGGRCHQPCHSNDRRSRTRHPVPRAAGLVRYSDNSLQLTDEGRRVSKRTETKDIFTTLDRLYAFLKKLPDVNDASNAESVLDRSTYLSALERYETAIAKELPELYGRGTSSGNRDADDGSTA